MSLPDEVTLHLLTESEPFRWAPRTGWNPSFFSKERLQCAAYYHHFLKTMSPAVAEQRALEAIYARKYGGLVYSEGSSISASIVQKNKVV